MNRRDVLKILAAGSIATLLPVRGFGAVLASGNKISLRCLGNRPGPGYRGYLDGRTHDGTVGLAPNTHKPYTGTQWRVIRSGESVWLECRGNIQGPRWLDGRTHDGTVGLAPNFNPPYTGTRWKVIPLDNTNPNIVALQSLGHIEGPGYRGYLDGRTQDGTVWLAPTTDAPFTGTRWEVRLYPVCIDEPCP